MVGEPLQTRMLEAGDPMQDLVIQMVEAMHSVCGPLTSVAIDPLDGMAAAMTAASMYAGSQFGLLLYMGAVEQKDTRRAVDAASRNFREGIKVGTNKAARVERSEFVGGTA